MSNTNNNLPDNFFGIWGNATVVSMTIQARQLCPCPADVEGWLPWWLFFWKWRFFLFIPRQIFEHFSREFRARFLHVHVVVTACHPEKGIVKLILGKSAPGIYRGSSYEQCMIDVWPCFLPKDSSLTLKTLDEFIIDSKTPYAVRHDNCIHFAWKLHQEVFGGQKDYEWNEYTKFWDRIAYRYMCNEEILILEAENKFDEANAIKEILQNLDKTP